MDEDETKEKAGRTRKKAVRGWKAFNETPEGLYCLGMLYEVGREYVHPGPIRICKRGFHFCPDLFKCYLFYSLDPWTAICEVEAFGKVNGWRHHGFRDSDPAKLVTDGIRLLRRLSLDDIMVQLAKEDRMYPFIHWSGLPASINTIRDQFAQWTCAYKHLMGKARDVEYERLMALGREHEKQSCNAS